MSYVTLRIFGKLKVGDIIECILYNSGLTELYVIIDTDLWEKNMLRIDENCHLKDLNYFDLFESSAVKDRDYYLLCLT